VVKKLNKMKNSGILCKLIPLSKPATDIKIVYPPFWLCTRNIKMAFASKKAIKF
jgi:hypothetical protein